MKLSTFIAVFALTLFAGCESVSNRMQERFATVPPQTRTFQAPRRDVYNACRAALKNIGLLQSHASLSEGFIEGYAPIRSGDLTRDTRQTTIKINLRENDNADTDVAVLVSEQSEGSFPGGVSEQDLRSHSLYELYFGAVQQALLEAGALKEPARS